MDANKIKSARARNPLKAARAVRAEIKKRGDNPGNITFVYGAKVRRDWVLKTDLELAAFLFLEASQEFASYTADPDEIVRHLKDEGVECSKPDFVFQRVRGQRGMFKCKTKAAIEQDERVKKQERLQKEHAAACGYTWGWFTEEHALRHQILLMNWLPVSSMLLQYRHQNVEPLQRAIADLVASGKARTISDVVARYDRAPMAHPLLAIYRAHQVRQITLAIDARPLTGATLIHVPGSRQS